MRRRVIPTRRALLDSVPKLRLDEAPVIYHPIAGELPSPLSPPPGCHFHPRCPLAEERCRSIVPPLVEVGQRREPRAIWSRHWPRAMMRLRAWFRRAGARAAGRRTLAELNRRRR